jgi:C4-type Zn-finger protein
MIYVTIDIFGHKVIKPITESCFLSDCPVCGNQVNIDLGVLRQIMDDGELEETSVYCDPCSEKYNENKRPKITLVK